MHTEPQPFKLLPKFPKNKQKCIHYDIYWKVSKCSGKSRQRAQGVNPASRLFSSLSDLNNAAKHQRTMCTFNVVYSTSPILMQGFVILSCNLGVTITALWKSCSYWSCAGAAKKSTSKKRNRFDEMQTSTLTQNLASRHPSCPDLPSANEGTQCWLSSKPLKSCE